DRIANDDSIPDLQAWVSTLRGQHAQDNPHLVKCLARALCLSKSSTSACERDFGNLIETFRKMLASPLLKEMHLRVTNFLKLEPDQTHEVVRRARAIWNEGYLADRLSGSKRSETGNFVSGIKLQQKRQAKDPMQSQAAWVKRRRLEVNKIASAMPDQPAGQPPVLPAAAKKAIAKMGQVVKKRRFEAQKLGILQKDEKLPDNEYQQVLKPAKKSSELEREFASRKFPSLKSRPTFVWTTAEGVREKLALLGAELVDAWGEATCHVVDCFNEPGQRVTWASKLNGHLIITKRLSKGPWIEKLG
ncbi:unnamed protein product, partial [Cladocopium goreaui]